MEFKLSRNNIIFIIVFSTLCLITTYLLYLFVYNPKMQTEFIKKNQYNSRSNVYMTSDKQASIYLSEYYNLLNNNITKAYGFVEEKESSIKFSNINDFKDYINKLNISNSTISKFRTYKSKGYTYYDIYDVYNNRFIFKSKGVINYTVIFK